MSVISRKELEEALPDYFAGAATGAVAKQIEDLARSDPEFASILEEERQLFAALSGPTEFELDRAADHDFTRLRARIEADTHSSARHWLSQLFVPLTAVAAVLVVTVGLLVLPTDDGQFRTLSDSVVVADDQVRVIFNELPLADRIERFEQRYGLNLHAGPDSANSYLFSIDDGRKVEDVVRLLRNDRELAFSGAR